MIKAHFHIFKGQKYWHVYSDEDVQKLLVWMIERNIPLWWLQTQKFPHLDLWGASAKHIKGLKIVKNRDFLNDIEMYKLKALTLK